jgi:Ni/Co efflux regulator RcnB
MRSRTILPAVLAASLLCGSFSFAQGDSPYRDPGRNGGQGQRYDNPGRRDNEGRMNNHNNRRNENRDRRDERGAGPDHAYYRGDRMPYQYRTRQYVVEDWRGHRLSAPPRGYQWVQSGGDYILVAIATGVILQLLLNN